jgi:hypothetical protein
VTHVYFVQDGNANGLFELNTSTGAATLVGLGISNTDSATDGLTETPSPFVLLGSRWNPLVNIDTDGSAAADIAGSAGMEGLAMNIATGALFGDINTAWQSLHPVTGVSLAFLAVPPFDVEGPGANPNANLVYAVGDSTNLVVYNPATNTWGNVGNTTINFDDGGACYDHVNNVIWAVEPGTDNLYRINPNTAAAALVGPLGTNGAGGLAFVVE